MISYKPLFITMAKKGLKNKDLRSVASTNVISKFAKNEHVNTATLDKLCQLLHCRIEDVIEVLPDPEPQTEQEQEHGQA